MGMIDKVIRASANCRDTLDITASCLKHLRTNNPIGHSSTPRNRIVNAAEIVLANLEAYRMKVQNDIPPANRTPVQRFLLSRCKAPSITQPPPNPVYVDASSFGIGFFLEVNGNHGDWKIRRVTLSGGKLLQYKWV
jgi:hypothetical protein